MTKYGVLEWAVIQLRPTCKELSSNNCEFCTGMLVNHTQIYHAWSVGSDVISHREVYTRLHIEVMGMWVLIFLMDHCRFK